MCQAGTDNLVHPEMPGCPEDPAEMGPMAKMFCFRTMKVCEEAERNGSGFGQYSGYGYGFGQYSGYGSGFGQYSDHYSGFGQYGDGSEACTKSDGCAGCIEDGEGNAVSGDTDCMWKDDYGECFRKDDYTHCCDGQACD